MRVIIILIYTLLTWLFTANALLADGVLEINQACADNGGCFSGDDPGLPVTIDGSAGNSYRLTSDLSVSSNFTWAIITQITSSDVQIDLNGFSIIGPITCSGSGSTLNCSGSGSGGGVQLNGPGSMVRNGAIRGMGGSGVAMGAKNRVSNLTVRWNGGYGIMASTGATIRDITAFENALGGIQTGDTASITNIVIFGNGGNGITCGGSCQVMDGLTSDNDGDGVEIGAAGLIHRMITRGNTGYGFEGTSAAQAWIRESRCNNNSLGPRNASTAILNDDSSLFCGPL